MYAELDTLVLDSEWHWIFDCTHFDELRHNLPIFHSILKNILKGRGFSTVEDLVCLLKKVQIQCHVGVSLGSFIRQAIALRGPWMSETCARGRLCAPPDHWPRDFFVYPPSDADFPEEVANKFDDGQPWFDFIDRFSDT